MSISFREASNNDVEACIRIMQENYPELTERHWAQVLKDDFKDVLNKKYISKFLLAIHDNTIVGFGCYMILRTDMYKLSWINIMPSYKKQGIGTELVKKLEADVRQSVSRSIKLKNINIVLETDKPIFYNKLGYTTFNEREGNDLMRKALPI